LAASHRGGLRPSRFAYFNYLADAFLHGQLHLRLVPVTTHDLSLFEGRWYLYWPPFPALVMMPFVAVWGVRFSDVLLTVLIGAANVALVAALFRSAVAQRLLRLSRLQRGLLVLFFAFGTVHLSLAPFGRVWFTSQLIAFGCVAFAYWSAIQLRGTLAFAASGLAIAAAFLTRNHLLLAGLWPAANLVRKHLWPDPARDRASGAPAPRAGSARIAGYIAIGLMPVLIAVVLLGAYNALRFGSAGENGLKFHKVGVEFAADYARFGAFSLHYVPINLFYQFLHYPLPIRDSSFMGGSLFWMSPVFLAAIPAAIKGQPRWSVWMLVATILLVATPILLLMGTGFFSFGPRYTLDFTVPLLLLSALGAQRWPVRWLALLVILSVAQYLYGVLHFMRVLQY
jgi:hypothetical protein